MKNNNHLFQTAFFRNDGITCVRNCYEFYSKKTKKKLLWKTYTKLISGMSVNIVSPPLKVNKKDRFIRVCEKKEM